MERAGAAALLGALFACGGNAAPTPTMPLAPPTTAPPTPTVAEPVIEAATAAGQPRIEILALGAEPRSPLRLTPVVGTPTGGDAVLDFRGHSDGGQTAAFQAAYGWSGSVREVGGRIGVTLAIDRVETEGVAADYRHLQIAYSLLPTGAMTSFDITSPSPNEKDQMVGKAIEDTIALAAVFPRTPVGIGARWRVDVERPVTAELVARDGARVRIRAAVEIKPDLNEPFTSEGSAEVEVDLDLGNVIATQRRTMTLRTFGTRTKQSLTADTTLTVTPRP
jgi:hypothetical protein